MNIDEGRIAPDLPTGLGPHFQRLAGKIASPGGVRALAREGLGLVRHATMYPLGLVPDPVRERPTGTDGQIETPVVLVHGYFHNRSGFFMLSRALRDQGFRWIHGMNYNPIGHSIPELADSFKRHVDDVRMVSGSDTVHIVGHSLGGVIARWYLQELDGDEHVDTCVTIGTPHRGTFAAYLGLGQAAREMRPGSVILRILERGFWSCRARVVNLYSDLDVLIVPASAGILPQRPNVHNCLIRDLGHTSLLVSPELIDQVVGHLMEDEPTASVHPLRRDEAS